MAKSETRAMVKRHFHEHADDPRGACGEPLGSKPFLIATSNLQRVSCLHCRKVLAAREAKRVPAPPLNLPLCPWCQGDYSWCGRCHTRFCYCTMLAHATESCGGNKR